MAASPATSPRGRPTRIRSSRARASNTRPIWSGRATSIAGALATIWDRVGIPLRIQFNNHSNLCGAIPPRARTLKPVVATCLDLGVIVRFAPLREPWRNGVVEHFNDVWDKSFFRTARHPDKDRPVFVHRSGRTHSIIGAKTLRLLGFDNVWALENGTMGWLLAGKEVERGTVRPALEDGLGGDAEITARARELARKVDVESALARAEARVGVIPQEAADGSPGKRSRRTSTSTSCARVCARRSTRSSRWCDCSGGHRGRGRRDDRRTRGVAVGCAR